MGASSTPCKNLERGCLFAGVQRSQEDRIGQILEGSQEHCVGSRGERTRLIRSRLDSSLRQNAPRLGLQIGTPRGRRSHHALAPSEACWVPTGPLGFPEGSLDGSVCCAHLTCLCREISGF